MGFAVGDLIDQKYRVLHALGAGGTGTVFAVQHIGLEKRRALKVLHDEAAARPKSRERFLREARAMVRLSSPHAVAVHDVAGLDGGAPYMVMEYVPGSDLADVLRLGPLPASVAVALTRAALDAIGEAHQKGIVHRDIKPSNLLVTARDDALHLTVLDFGITKAMHGDHTALTGTGELLGTPSYMAPEQMRSARAADQRSDVWSVGVVLYELLTGRRPFVGADIIELCASAVRDQPDPPSATAAACPPALDAVVLRCMAKRPDDRFADASALDEALGALEPTLADATDYRRRLLAHLEEPPSRA